MAIKVNPNRMELLKLRRRAAMAKRGHKLLKDKFDELTKQFMALIRENRALRREVEEALAFAGALFSTARAEAPIQVIDDALSAPRASAEVIAHPQSVLGVHVSSLELKLEGGLGGYSLEATPSILDESLLAYRGALEKIIRLAELEKKVAMLAREIERTRRRVNALEFVLIPQLDEAIRFITMKLDEQERANITRLLKIKEIVAESAI